MLRLPFNEGIKTKNTTYLMRLYIDMRDLKLRTSSDSSIRATSEPEDIDSKYTYSHSYLNTPTICDGNQELLFWDIGLARPSEKHDACKNMHMAYLLTGHLSTCDRILAGSGDSEISPAQFGIMLEVLSVQVLTTLTNDEVLQEKKKTFAETFHSQGDQEIATDYNER